MSKSTPMALAQSEACLIEEGVFFLDDPEVVRRVQEINEKRFPFQTVTGLDFCRISTLQDDVSEAQKLYGISNNL
jgi:hypothetical protein